jgi:superfamily II DNA or RNA helicase
MSGADVQRTPSPGLVLRPYQLAAIEQISGLFRVGIQRVLFVLPTGGGKTVLFCHAGFLAVMRNGKVLIVVHRIELADQVSETMRQFEVECGFIAAGRPDNLMAPVQIAVINTLVRRVRAGRYLNAFDLVMVDEAHHFAAPTWLETIPRTLSDRAFVLGVTATPERSDGRGLDWFQEMVVGPGYAELQQGGYLVRAITYAPPIPPDLSGVRTRGGDFLPSDLARVMATTDITGDAVEHYRRLALGRPALAYGVSIAHSQQIAAHFRDAGVSAMHVDGDSGADARNAALTGLVDGSVKVVSNCGLFTEGVDAPPVACAIILRPTKSIALHVQMPGRAVRPCPGKTDALILDHAGNALRHGLYDFPHRWSLIGTRSRDDDT